MKWIYFLPALIFLGCNQNMEELSSDKIVRVKKDIIRVSEKHAQDLVNKDFEEVMKFYGDDKNFIIFGDGYYWGGHEIVEGIWKEFLGDKKKMLKWDLKNHKIYVFSNDAVSYLVEFNNERVEETGDTTIVTGCFTYGMRKIEDQWKAVTVHISHNYKPGYGFERSHVGYDAEKNGRNWWKYYSTEDEEENME
ncbi:nuclear transport factor 2 family protein [Pricia sp.]|uniref:nuclear transport factor 2 family protein n=1 Tax=Pricia sp. TaxID=2268138 RepID=UPI0035943AB9